MRLAKRNGLRKAKIAVGVRALATAGARELRLTGKRHEIDGLAGATIVAALSWVLGETASPAAPAREAAEKHRAAIERTAERLRNGLRRWAPGLRRRRTDTAPH
jgi:hypothetical protein